MLNFSFTMTYLLPIIIIGVVAWLLELYWKRRAGVQSVATSSIPSTLAVKPEVKSRKQKKHIVVQSHSAADDLKIIFADLGGASGLAQSNHIFDGLQSEIQSGSEVLPIKLIRSSETLSLDEGGTVKLKEKGQALLKYHDADVLIWGQIFSANSDYNLSFLKNETKGRDLYTRLLCGLEKIRLKGGALSSDDGVAIITIVMAHAFEICDKAQKSKILALKSLDQRAAQEVPVKEEIATSMNREKLWASAWWHSVSGLQQNHKAKLVKASALWTALLKIWPLEDSSYDGASARNNLAVVCYFLGENTEEMVWYNRSHQLALKAQAYFRKTGYPRRWAELEFLRLSSSSFKAIQNKDKKTQAKNETAFMALQEAWPYEDHADFWARIDVALDRLRKV